MEERRVKKEGGGAKQIKALLLFSLRLLLATTLSPLYTSSLLH